MSELPCPYCGSNCEIPSDMEEKIECPNCGCIFLYSQRSTPRTIDCRPSPKINDRQMSELKVYHHELRHNEYEEFYLKYEADKVIAEQKERYFELQDTAIKIDKELTETRKQLRHQKYKRCQANANYWVAISYHCIDDKRRQRAERHHRKWLEFANKFKDKE